MKNIFFLILILFLFSCKKNDKLPDIDLNFLKKSSYKTDTNTIKNGENIFNGSCSTCHLYGVGGSSLINDKKYWKDLIDKKPLNRIYSNVFNGISGKKGIMPRRGGCIKCSDKDLVDAVNYIFSYNGIRINN